MPGQHHQSMSQTKQTKKPTSVFFPFNVLIFFQNQKQINESLITELMFYGQPYFHLKEKKKKNYDTHSHNTKQDLN